LPDDLVEPVAELHSIRPNPRSEVEHRISGCVDVGIDECVQSLDWPSREPEDGITRQFDFICVYQQMAYSLMLHLSGSTPRNMLRRFPVAGKDHVHFVLKYSESSPLASYRDKIYANSTSVTHWQRAFRLLRFHADEGVNRRMSQQHLVGLQTLAAGNNSALRKQHREGTHRTRTPAETMATIRPRLPLFGITRIGHITGLDCIGIPVVVVTRPNSRSLAVSQGKGVTVDCAIASAVMESVEAWHAERIDLPLRLANYEEMRWTTTTVDVTGLPRDGTSNFRPEIDLLWSQGWDLLSHNAVWVPYELVHTRFTVPRPAGSGCFVASSNGLASGNNLVEALCHALCEVIERDAVTLWQISPREVRDSRRIDPATIDDPTALSLLDRCRDAGVLASIWDVTSDVGVPAFYCMLADGANDQLHVMHSAAGMGCHPSKAVALTRAITEAAQSRLTIIAGSRDDVVRDDYARIRDPEVLADNLHVASGAPDRAFTDISEFTADDLVSDLNWLLKRVRSAGFSQVAAFDLSKSDVGVAVARVVVPGMETSGLLGNALGQRALRHRDAYVALGSATR
jgi:ribosomal protein S12 methylthiotransferase accessory factor